MRQINLISEQSEVTITTINQDNTEVILRANIIGVETDETKLNIQFIRGEEQAELDSILELELDINREFAVNIKKIIRKLIIKGYYTTKIEIKSSLDTDENKKFLVSILSNWNDGVELIDESEAILDDIQDCDTNSHMIIRAIHEDSLDIEDIDIEINTEKTLAKVILKDGYNFKLKLHSKNAYDIIREISESLSKYALRIKYVKLTFSVFTYRFMISEYDENLLIFNIH